MRNNDTHSYNTTYNNNIDSITKYKGMYFNHEDEQKYYEGGAHFGHKDLCKRLEKIVMKISPERRGKTMYEDWTSSKGIHSY